MLTIRSFPLSVFAVTFACAGLVGSLPAAAQTAAPPEVGPPTTDALAGATPRQRAWLRATPEERVTLAEKLGEDGARAFARQRGWKPVFDGVGRTLRQGPDQVWRDADGIVHVLEAKGGTSQVARAYGHVQGSPEWAVKSAERFLRSARATAGERKAAQAVLEAAANGRLTVDVVRTSHVLGEPTVAVLEQSVNCTDEAARLARGALERLARKAATAAGSIDDVARAGEAAAASRTVSTALRTTARVAVPVAVAFDAGLRVNEGVHIERRFAASEITQEQREVEHARNVAGMAGGWGGAWAGAKLGAMGGCYAGTGVAPGPGTVVGGVAGGIVGGVVGYVGGEAAAEAAAEWTVDRVHAAGTTVADLAHNAWDGTKHAAEATVQAAGDVWSWTADSAESLWNSTTGVATRAWRWVAGD